MPRNMSFMLTTEQVRNRTKTVTRRLGWNFLKPGDVLNACVKCQGLGKGGKIERICQIRVVSNLPSTLYNITKGDVKKEGFPGMTPVQFARMFCEHMGGAVDQQVNRIEFEYLPPATPGEPQR